MASTESTATVKIDSLAYGPYGIGRKDGKVILVPLTAPGDEAEVRIVESQANYDIAQLSSLARPSPLRRTPPCPYFAECGGCPWQHVRYEAQLAAKEKILDASLRRIGKLDGFELYPIRPSPQEYHYRRRIRLHLDEDRRIGFHRPFSHKLVEIDSCLIADTQADRHLDSARDWVKGLKTVVQEVEIVVGDEESGAILAARAEGKFALEDDDTNARFLERCKEIKGLILWGHGRRRSWGQEKIAIQLEGGLRMELDGELFSQVNPKANQHLISEVLRWGEFQDNDRILEFYCGAGNFTLPVARRAKEVVAVETNSRSIDNGKTNSRLNGLGNIRWICSPAFKATKKLRLKAERFSKIILNPPRSGAKELQQDLPSFGAKKLLYVSCDPPTLARDLGALSQKGYKLSRVRPFDLFPHTFHMETLAEMVRQ